MISPEAAKKVDDADLLRQLTNPNGDKPDPQAIQKRMMEMLDRMNESDAQASDQQGPRRCDPGNPSAALVTDLDVMIEIARQQQQQGSGSSQQQGPPKPGQQDAFLAKAKGTPSNGTGGDTPADGNEMTKNDGQSEAATGDIRNHDAANWGGLPPRDRDEIFPSAPTKSISPLTAI